MSLHNIESNHNNIIKKGQTYNFTIIQYNKFVKGRPKQGDKMSLEKLKKTQGYYVVESNVKTVWDIEP